MINPFSKTFSSEELGVFQFLCQIRFFEKLKDIEMASFFPAIHYRKYVKDEIVFFRNDPSQALYLIKSGTVNLTLDIKGNFEVIQKVRSGEAFGENSLLEDSKRIYTAMVSSEEADFIVLPHFSIQEIFKTHPKIKAKMMTSLSEFYDQNNQRLFKSYQNSFGFFNLGEMFDKG